VNEFGPVGSIVGPAFAVSVGAGALELLVGDGLSDGCSLVELQPDDTTPTMAIPLTAIAKRRRTLALVTKFSSVAWHI
jgi:hypothetical protein